MAEKKKPGKTKGLAKKAAIAQVTHGGIALLHKHSDKLPALAWRSVQRSLSLTRAGLLMALASQKTSAAAR